MGLLIVFFHVLVYSVHSESGLSLMDDDFPCNLQEEILPGVLIFYSNLNISLFSRFTKELFVLNDIELLTMKTLIHYLLDSYIPVGKFISVFSFSKSFCTLVTVNLCLGFLGL
jgi:hypothetical protein